MRLTILIAGLLVITAAGTYLQVRWIRRNADAELQAFALTVAAPLTDEVRRWLAPQLLRRSLYPALGVLAGVTAANIPLAPPGTTCPGTGSPS